MARSFKHVPISGITTARSEKQDKRIANRILRHRQRQAIRTCRDYDDLVLPIMREAFNVWSMAKDGKMRFDPQKYPKLLRK